MVGGLELLYQITLSKIYANESDADNVTSVNGDGKESKAHKKLSL